MPRKYGKIIYATAILAGPAAVAVTTRIPLGPINEGLLYLFLGALFGFLWPREQWRWGLYISLPIAGLIGLSILFAGLGGNIKGDLFFILASILGSTVGSLIGSQLGMKLRKIS